MSSLYQIDNEIYKTFALLENEELTAEQCAEILENLAGTRETKIENTALFIKNLRAEVDALNNEIKSFNARKQQKENLIKTLSNNIEFSLRGKKFETDKVLIKFTKSQRLSIVDEDRLVAELKRKKVDDCYTVTRVVEKKVDKTQLKKLMNNSALKIKNAYITEHENMQIK